MGFRNRLKNRLKKTLGSSDAHEVVQAPPSIPQPTAAPPPAPPAPPQPDPVVSTVPPDSVQTEAEDPEEALKAQRAAKHFEKTRKAMLRFIVEEGGEASMAAMHELSERRYFIGHRRFSDLMEGLVAEGLIDFDHDTGMANVTDQGRDYVAE